MSRDPLTERERHDQSHPDEIMGHPGREIQPVAGEIYDLPDVLDVCESGIERADVHGQG